MKPIRTGLIQAKWPCPTGTLLSNVADRRPGRLSGRLGRCPRWGVVRPRPCHRPPAQRRGRGVGGAKSRLPTVRGPPPVGCGLPGARRQQAEGMLGGLPRRGGRRGEGWERRGAQERAGLGSAPPLPRTPVPVPVPLQGQGLGQGQQAMQAVRLPQNARHPLSPPGS